MFIERDITTRDKPVKKKKKYGFTETPLKVKKSKAMTEMIDSDKIKSEVKEIKKDVKEEMDYLNLLLPTSNITEDTNDDSQDESGDDGDEIDEKKFLEEIAFLDGKKTTILGTRGFAVAEIENNPTDDNRIEMDDLLKSLDKGTNDLSRRADISSKKDVLAPQLHRQAEERINQAAGYQRVRGEVDAWGSIVEENRVGESMSFPLQEPDIRIKTASEIAKSRFAPETPLEIQIAQMLAGSASTMKDGEELSELEARALEGLTPQEIKERRAELAKFRALRQFQVKKKMHQNKIKSKSYRRLVRKMKSKQRLAELENLAETDPEAAAHQIEMLHRNRILERATQKHTKSRYMTDLKKRQRMTNSKDVRKEFQGQMQNEIAKHRELVAKQKIVSESEDERNDSEDDSEDDFIEANKEESYDDFAAGYRKYWEAQQAEKKAKMSAADEIEDMFDEAEYARKERIAIKKMKRANNTDKDGDESDSDDEQDDETVESLDKQRTRVSGLSGSNTRHIILPPTIQSTIDNQEEDVRDANADLAAVRNKTAADLAAATNKSSGDGSTNKDNKNKKSDVDPDDFMVVKPKKLKSGVPEVYGYNDADSDDEESKQREMIAEAFVNDDVLEDFAKEKAAIAEANRPKDVDTFLPGWGSWGGTGIKVDERKKKRFLLKAPPPAKRRDDNKEDVIVNYDKDKVIKQHQVSRIPNHFNSVSDFEASIRAPIGNTFIPRTAHLKLIKPRLTTKMGHVIEPMDKTSLLNKNAEVIEELKLFAKEDFEEKMGNDIDEGDKPQTKRIKV